MKRARPVAIWVVTASGVFAGRPSIAEAAGPSCEEKITRSTIVACALAGGTGRRIAIEEQRAAEGRVEAAGVVLPSNPELSLEAARRWAPDAGSTFDWSASLSQTFEIGGQRSARLELAEGMHARSSASVRVISRAIAASALIAYLDVLAALELLQLTDRLAEAAGTLTTVVQARSAEGVAAPLDAAVAYAAGVQLLRARARAERRWEERRAELAVRLGLDPRAPPRIEGEVAPLTVSSTDAAVLLAGADRERPELVAAKAEHRAALAAVEVLRRERIPNLTLSIFVAHDGFDERVAGGALALPIPLPSPLGRVNAGEIAGAEARERRSALELEQLRRNVHLEVVSALADFESRTRELRLFDSEHARRAEQTLSALAEEIASGRLGARDALTSEQALLELLRAHLEAKHAVAAASVELARAAGLPLEGQRP